MRQPALSEERCGDTRHRLETIQFAVRTSCGWLDLTRGPGHIGIRGDSFEALFSLAQGGIVSFRRGEAAFIRQAVFPAGQQGAAGPLLRVQNCLKKCPARVSGALLPVMTPARARRPDAEYGNWRKNI